MGKILKWLAIIVVAVIALGTIIGIDEDTVEFLAEMIVCAVLLFIAVVGIVAATKNDDSSENEQTSKAPTFSSEKEYKPGFFDDIEIESKDIEDLYINDLFWEAEQKRQQENNKKK